MRDKATPSYKYKGSRLIKASNRSKYKTNLLFCCLYLGLLVGRGQMGILGWVFKWGSVCVGSNGFRGQRVGARWAAFASWGGTGWGGVGGWEENRSAPSCSRKKATPPPSPLPATVAAAPPLLRRPQIEVLLFHLASPFPAHHPFLFLDGSLAPFLFLQDDKICGGGAVVTA